MNYVNGDAVSYVASVFRGKVIGGEMRPDGHEILDAKYLSRQELESLPHAAWVRDAMEAIFSREGSPGFQPSTWRP